MNYTYRMKRREDVKRRASTPDYHNQHCKVLDCSNPSRAGTTDGLSRKYCRSHYDHLQRHGSPFKPSYKAADINPHRKAALKWLKKNAEDRWVKHAVTAVHQLYQRAGPHVEAFRLRGMTPRERAWAAWARLRKAEIDPIKVVASWLAIELTIKHDPQPDWRNEFKRVQGAKLVHRLASGSHKKWMHEYGDGSGTWIEKLDKYPQSRGRVLRHIGEDLDKAFELLVDHHLDHICPF